MRMQSRSGRELVSRFVPKDCTWRMVQRAPWSAPCSGVPNVPSAPAVALLSCAQRASGVSGGLTILGHYTRSTRPVVFP
jgi:hypothetical protein